MRKTLHRYRVQGSDDARVSEFTRWKAYGSLCAVRKDAWALATAALQAGFRHVRVIEERIYKGRD
jgi:hypothetical protein